MPQMVSKLGWLLDVKSIDSKVVPMSYIGAHIPLSFRYLVEAN
jgi:hypothetical protein